MRCRSCSETAYIELVDLINSPPSNSYLNEEQLSDEEIYYPLRVLVCTNCWLTQIDESKKCEEIFDKDYSYFSSYSKSWLDHCEKYVHMIVKRLKLNESSSVMEVASNDGYLLQYFKNKNINCIGIEPTDGTAKVSKSKGIETIVEFFNEDLANRFRSQNRLMDLVIGNNVLAHVPDINNFVKGLSLILKPSGVITMEFPHLMELIDKVQFDTVYHEHYSYLSLYSVRQIFAKQGLNIFDVEKLPTHGGSLRIYACNQLSQKYTLSKSVQELIDSEYEFGLNDAGIYLSFSEKVEMIKNNFLSFLIDCSFKNKTVIGYGAAAKGNTLLNYCGIKNDLIQYVVDASPYKVGKYMPGSHLPIMGEEQIVQTKPDYIVIFPWNIKEEILKQLAYVREWGCKFVVAVPKIIID